MCCNTHRPTSGSVVEAAFMGTHSVTVEQIRCRRFSWSLVLKLQRAMVQHPTCESLSGVVLTLALRIGSGAASGICSFGTGREFVELALDRGRLLARMIGGDARIGQLTHHRGEAC